MRLKSALILVGLAACSRTGAPEFDLEALFVDVFAPKQGERVLVLVDLPSDDISDNDAWADRRAMAGEWISIISGMGERLDVHAYPLMTFQATGAHNAPLPTGGTIAGEQIGFDEVLPETNIVIALTEFSATAPLSEYVARYPNLRVASMPMVSRSMQSTALAADYGMLSQKCRTLWARLDRAVGATVTFSTGHEMYFDLRHRSAEVDDGRLDGTPGSARLINLPSGEAFAAPYEGEIQGDVSRTRGEMPLWAPTGEGYAVIVVEANRIVEVRDGGNAAEFAAEASDFLAQDPALQNVAELGLGCNASAVVTGNVLEDEKVIGIHWALGRSDHIGGTVGPEDFSDPSQATHLDFVYPASGGPVNIQVSFNYAGGSQEEIIVDGENRILADPPGLSDALGPALLIWLLLAGGSWTWVAWDAERYKWSPTSRKYLWALAALAFGPVGLGLYLRAPQRKAQPFKGIEY
jgi:hypothetical protein